MSTGETLKVLDDKLLHMDLPTNPPGDPVDPYPHHTQVREDRGVEVIEGRFGPGGPATAFAYRYEDVVAVLKDHETYSSAALHDFTSPFMGEYVLLGMDPPKHARYRTLVSRAFSPRLLMKWENDLIGAVADSLIDGFQADGRAELIADFAFSFPAQVIARLVGVPQENFAQFQGWAADIIGGVGDPPAGIASSQALRAYLAPFVAERRENPQDDFISAVVQAELDGDRLSDEEVYSFLCLLLPAGIETTFRAIGNLLFNLLTHPDQLDALRKDRTLVPAAIEEGLRFDTPVQAVPRTVTRDTELNGVKLPAGTFMMPVFGAANRDPALNEDPDRFDIHRKTIRYATFGSGVHTCLGLHLAKMELRVALEKLLDRLPGLRFDAEAAEACGAHIRGTMFRSPVALPVLWDA